MAKNFSAASVRAHASSARGAANTMSGAMAPKTLSGAGVEQRARTQLAPPAHTRGVAPRASRPERAARAADLRLPRSPERMAGAGRALAVGGRALAAATRRVPPALLVATLGALALALLSLALPHEQAPRGDDLVYERMARDPLGTHTFPFAYRIGVPWLVHVLPLGHTLGFELLAWLAAGGAAGCAYLLMRRLGTPAGLAAALALALALSPPMLLVGLRSGRNVDAATLLFLTAATLLAVERRARALAATLALGVLVREAELFVIPLAYALWAERWWDPRAARRVLAVGAPALALFLALRLAIPTVGGAQVPGYGGSLLGARLALLETGVRDGFVEARRMLSVYGPLWLAAPLALLWMPFARRGLMLVAACALAMTFALDWGRMILLAAPVFYPAGAFTLTRHPRWRVPALAAFALLIGAYALHMALGGAQAGILESPPPPYPLR